MDLVNHHHHIDRVVGRLAVGARRVVTGDAVRNVGARSAVELQSIVARETGVVVDDVARQRQIRRGTRRRQEVERSVVRGRDRQLVVAAQLETDAMGERAVVGGAVGRIAVERLGERVGVRSVAVVREYGAIGRGILGGRLQRAVVQPRDVGVPRAALSCAARPQLRDRKADVVRRQRPQRLTELVAQVEAHSRVGVVGDRHTGDFGSDRLRSADVQRRPAARPGGTRRSGRAGGALRTLCTVVPFAPGQNRHRGYHHREAPEIGFHRSSPMSAIAPSARLACG